MTSRLIDKSSIAAARLIEAGIVTEADLDGCSDAEIAGLEAALSLSLPARVAVLLIFSTWNVASLPPWLRMSTSLLYRLFGTGKIPRPMATVLEQEGLVLQEEGLSGSVTFKNFRAPGRRHGFKRSWFVGSIAITRLRVVAFAFSRPIINLPLEPDQLKKLDCTLKDETTLSIAFDAAVFHDDRSGSVEYRFKTDQAGLFLKHLDDFS